MLQWVHLLFKNHIYIVHAYIHTYMLSSCSQFTPLSNPSTLTDLHSLQDTYCTYMLAYLHTYIHIHTHTYMHQV